MVPDHALFDHILDLIADDPIVKHKGRAPKINDLTLARMLGVRPEQISNIRAGRLQVGDTILVAIQELTGMHVKTMYKMLGKNHG